MTYTALNVLFLLLCVGAGALRPDLVRSRRTAPLLAVAMVVAQFAILVFK